MFWNNVKIALRNLRKHKGFAAINITGLAIGLTVYVFGGLIVEYERTHDLFYENAERIYTIGATAAPELNVGVSKFNAVQSIVGPSIESNIPDVEAVARTIIWEYLIGIGSDRFYEPIRFADPALLERLRMKPMRSLSGVTTVTVLPFSRQRSPTASSSSVVRAVRIRFAPASANA